MKYASYNTRDVKKTCENKLNIEFRSGKEFNGWFYFQGKKTARITVSKGRKSIKPKTYKSMARQLFLTIQQFDDFLECPFGLPEYQEHLRERARRDIKG